MIEWILISALAMGLVWAEWEISKPVREHQQHLRQLPAALKRLPRFECEIQLNGNPNWQQVPDGYWVHWDDVEALMDLNKDPL